MQTPVDHSGELEEIQLKEKEDMLTDIRTIKIEGTVNDLSSFVAPLITAEK